MGFFKKDLWEYDGFKTLLVYASTATQYMNVILKDRNVFPSYHEIDLLRREKIDRHWDIGTTKGTYLGLLEIFFIQHFSYLLYKIMQNNFPSQLNNSRLLFSNKKGIDLAILVQFYGTSNFYDGRINFNALFSDMLSCFRDTTAQIIMHEISVAPGIHNTVSIKIGYNVSNILMKVSVWDSFFEDSIKTLNNDAKFTPEFLKQLKLFYKEQNDALIEKIAAFAIKNWEKISNWDREQMLDYMGFSLNKLIEEINSSPLFDKALTEITQP